jgi:D-sedoheptulose 7-phosphate isomerase
MTHAFNPTLRDAFLEAAHVLATLTADARAMATIDAMPGLFAKAVRAKGKLMICGNGGSSCDAAHFAEELTGRFRAERPPIAAIACTDIGHVTCTANDYGFDHIFSRWVGALGQPGDVLVVLSTSGNSNNIVHAVHQAKKSDMTTVSLLGKSGGVLAGMCEHEIIVPGATSDRIQELHMLILHAWCEGLERELGYAK